MKLEGVILSSSIELRFNLLWMLSANVWSTMLLLFIGSNILLFLLWGIPHDIFEILQLLLRLLLKSSMVFTLSFFWGLFLSLFFFLLFDIFLSLPSEIFIVL